MKGVGRGCIPDGVSGQDLNAGGDETVFEGSFKYLRVGTIVFDLMAGVAC
ncbi:MAG: hypothetical protein ACNA7J_05775 [Wenzhouxiangella sp.]